MLDDLYNEYEALLELWSGGIPDAYLDHIKSLEVALSQLSDEFEPAFLGWSDIRIMDYA